MMLAHRYRMSKRRVMAKAKMYGFFPWVDQVDSIAQIMKENGEKTESALLRKLVDEALDARRKNSQSVPLAEKPNHDAVRLEKIESLLMRLIQEQEVSLRISDICLALVQNVLAEAYATRKLLWESVVLPHLRGAGIDADELERQFVLQEDQAKDYAYGEALRIKESQEPAK